MILDKQTKTPETAFIILADGEVDQVCENRQTANKEKRDLIAMGCQVKIITCPWSEQGELLDVLESC